MQTFDTMDAVVLIQSNCLRELEKCLRKLENISQIVYLYTIVGVAQSYLNICSEKKIELKWNERDCNIEKKIPLLTLKIASENPKKIRTIIESKSIMETDINKYFKEADFKYMHGHHNVFIQFRNIPVKFLIFCFCQMDYYRTKMSCSGHQYIILKQTAYMILILRTEKEYRTHR